MKRVLLMIPTRDRSSSRSFSFFILRAIPGDVCELRACRRPGGYCRSRQQIKIFAEQELGLDQPLLPTVLATFLVRHGDVRLRQLDVIPDKPVMLEIGLRFELSLQVAIMATLTSDHYRACRSARISAVYQNTWIDYVVRTVSRSPASPSPRSGWAFSSLLGLLTFTQSMVSGGFDGSPPIELQARYGKIRGTTCPSSSGPRSPRGISYSAVATRMTRSSLLEVLREDYVRTARAKGLLEKVIINRHALQQRNAAGCHRHRH